MVIVFPKKHEYVYLAIALMYVSVVIDLAGSLVGVNFPLLKYALLFFALVFYIKGILQTKVSARLIAPGILMVFRFFLGWSIIMVLMSFDKIIAPDNNYINFKIIISGKLFISTIPFIIFSNPSEYLVKKCLKIAFFLCIVLLVIVPPLIFFNQREYFEIYGVIFGGGVSILVLTYLYHSKTVRWISFFSLFMILFINAVNARRNQFLFFGSVLFFTGLIPLLSQSSFVRKRKKLIIAGILSFCFLIFLFVLLNINNFSYLVERSKTGVESREDFLEEFYQDFNDHPTDWITGRGVLGDFKSTIYEKGSDNESRAVIETAYLDHIMRGGYIYLFFLVIITLPAIFMGFFRSNNILCKAFAAIILINFIDMVGFGIPALSLKYLLIWIGVSVCYSRQMRSYSDEYFKKAIGLKIFI